MADPTMAVSLKILKNKAYTVVPVFSRKDRKVMRTKECLLGIRLLYTKSRQDVWLENNGLIELSQLSGPAREYVVNELTDQKYLKIFGTLGD